MTFTSIKSALLMQAVAGCPVQADDIVYGWGQYKDQVSLLPASEHEASIFADHLDDPKSIYSCYKDFQGGESYVVPACRDLQTIVPFTETQHG